MAYRAPNESASFASKLISQLSSELNTFPPSSTRSDVKNSSLNQHFRLNTLVKVSLENAGFRHWDEVCNVTIQELLDRKIINLEGAEALLKYAHRVSLLKENDSESEHQFQNLINPDISNSDLIILESNIPSIRSYLTSEMHSWTETQQRIFCWKFFSQEDSIRISKKVNLPHKEVDEIYRSLLREFQNQTFLGDLIELITKLKWEVLDRWWLIQEIPELDIRPFNKFKNYRALDLILNTIPNLQIGEDVIDLSQGSIGKAIIKSVGFSIIDIDKLHSFHPNCEKMQPNLMMKYMEYHGFSHNHLYIVNSAISQENLLLTYFEKQGKPLTKSQIKSDLAWLLDSISIIQKIFETNGKIIPITNDSFALADWGFEPFLGASEIIAKYITDYGPQHLEMLPAILDGYGVSERKIKEIASSPPFALIDGVCFLMND